MDEECQIKAELMDQISMQSDLKAQLESRNLKITEHKAYIKTLQKDKQIEISELKDQITEKDQHIQKL